LKFLELKNHISQKRLLPCYFVTGDDPFVMKKAEQMFASLCGSFSQLNFTRFADKTPASELVNALNAIPMLAEYRVVVVENYSLKIDEIKKYLLSPNPSSILVFVGPMSSNFSSLVKEIEVVDCSRLEPSYLMNWAGAKITKAGCPTTKEAMLKLVEYCSRDMNRINGETDKLIAYAGGKPVTEETIESLIAPDLEFKVFELTDAIAYKNAPKAVAIVEKMLEENGAQGKVFGLIYNHFRRLLHISLNPNETNLSTLLKVQPYAITAAKKQLSRFTIKRLKAIVDKLDDVDFTLKTNSSYAKTVITSFVCETILIG
ncbi:MAG: DNA polymerase III subunit delta, partial [Clostridia bacterium]|nr:DNA polymerase III subunit delta [Clostridia bacterium]